MALGLPVLLTAFKDKIVHPPASRSLSNTQNTVHLRHKSPYSKVIYSSIYWAQHGLTSPGGLFNLTFVEPGRTSLTDQNASSTPVDLGEPVRSCTGAGLAQRITENPNPVEFRS